MNLLTAKHGPLTNEAVEYLDSAPEIGLSEAQARIERVNLDQPSGRFYEANILSYWQNNCGRFPHLSRIARDILGFQGGSVGVERIFSIARDVLPYCRSRLKSKSI